MIRENLYRESFVSKMRVLFVLLLCLCGPGLASDGESLNSKNALGVLEIKIAGLETVAGQVRVAVFNSEGSWLETPVYANVLDVSELSCRWNIEEVPFGNYGIAVFHDVNGNGENDTNFIGIPKEPYGFSNGARALFSPPKWRDSFFTVSSPNHTVEIQVK